jgi:5-methylcytosine-specific restriction enzyme subunit McrC
MLAFLINTANLYERFVAAWMVANIPSSYDVRVQERMQFGVEPGHNFAIDMVIYHRQTRRPYAVVDTKYKVPATSPASSDLAQVVAYATAKGCKDALLIYPIELARPFDQQIGDVRVRSVAFNLDNNLALAGEQLLQSCLSTSHER